ncbi:MAG: hypothetical protein SGARI_006142, partial [Bacillariaceae sp.]
MDMNSTSSPNGMESHTRHSCSSAAVAPASQTRGYPSIPRRNTAGSSQKRKAHKGGKATATKIKFHSASCPDAAQQETAYHKLDPSVEQHAHKMQQRHKAIQKGKNTIGYEIYCNKVPKKKRLKRSMDTPSTPDHTLDIPNKKWNGMVKAWRVALHKYDPKDLQASFNELQEYEAAEKAQDAVGDTSQPKTVKEQELEQAKTSGLLDFVHLGSSNLSGGSNKESSPPPQMSQSNVSMDAASPAAFGSNQMSELDQWESAAQQDNDSSVMDSSAGEESDDD